jgi:hypothetical protein
VRVEYKTREVSYWSADPQLCPSLLCVCAREPLGVSIASTKSA